MHGTAVMKVTDQESGKSCIAKRQGGSKTIAALRLKKGGKTFHSKVQKAKSRVKKIRSTLFKRKVIDPSSKVARNGSSTSRKVSNKKFVHKRRVNKTSKKQDSVKIQEDVMHGNSDENGENGENEKLGEKKKGQKDNSELDEASRLQRRTRYLLIKMKLEQNLIDAYSGEGWKGQSREKIRPEKELLRAKKQILKCKLGLRDAIRQLDLLSAAGSIEESVIASDGSVHHEHIFCAKCKLREAFPDNDIILCDGTCNRAFHQKCLDPPLETQHIPPGDQGWFCKFCECKIEILDAMNAHIGTYYSEDSNWQDIFKEEASFPDGNMTSLNQEEEWPSDDSKDDDYDPERREKSHSGDGIDNNEEGSDDDDSSTSLSWSLHDEAFSGPEREGLDSADCGVIFDEGSDREVVCGRRRRSAVDYKKLYAEMFGKDATLHEQVSEDEDWGPGRRKRKEKESDAINTLMTLYEGETKSPDVNREEVDTEFSTDPKSRRQLFRIPPAAVEKLRVAFAENELPSRSVRQSLARELGLDFDKVNKWFKNSRYLALKSRKEEGAKQPERTNASGTPEKSVSEAEMNHTANFVAVEDASQETALREIGDDIILKKLIKSKEKKQKEKRAADGTKEYEAEMERLCKAKLRLERMKETLLRHGLGKTKKLSKRHSRHQENVIYIPIAELKEKFC